MGLTFLEYQVIYAIMYLICNSGIPPVLILFVYVECFKYFGSMLTNDGRCTREIKSRIAMAKAAFSKNKTLFTSRLDLNLRKKLIKC